MIALASPIIITAFCTVMLGGLIQTIRQYGDKAWSNFNG